MGGILRDEPSLCGRLRTVLEFRPESVVVERCDGSTISMMVRRFSSFPTDPNGRVSRSSELSFAALHKLNKADGSGRNGPTQNDCGKERSSGEILRVRTRRLANCRLRKSVGERDI